MRFEHGSHRTECLAALIVLLLLLLLCCCRCCRCSSSSSTDDSRRRPTTFGTVPSQCLPLDEAVAPWDACGGARGRQHVRLRFCDAYEPARLLRGPKGCTRPGLDGLMRLDARARQAAAQFATLIDRYDCENANSVSWTCKDCEVRQHPFLPSYLPSPINVGLPSLSHTHRGPRERHRGKNHTHTL